MRGACIGGGVPPPPLVSARWCTPSPLPGEQARSRRASASWPRRRSGYSRWRTGCGPSPSRRWRAPSPSPPPLPSSSPPLLCSSPLLPSPRRTVVHPLPTLDARGPMPAREGRGRARRDRRLQTWRRRVHLGGEHPPQVLRHRAVGAAGAGVPPPPHCGAPPVLTMLRPLPLSSQVSRIVLQLLTDGGSSASVKRQFLSARQVLSPPPHTPS